MSKASQLGFKEIRLSMGLFDFDVICIIGAQKNADTYVNWKFETNEVDDIWENKGYEARGRCYYKAGYVPVIWIPRKPRTPREQATLAHECLHAVMHLYDWAGLTVSYQNEEVMCHAMAHLINSIMEKA